MVLNYCETHIQQTSIEVIYDVPGYVFTSRPRLTGKGGGVGTYISDKVNWSRRDDLEDDKIEVMWIELCPNLARGVLIAVIYRLPTTPKFLHNNSNELLNTMLSNASVENKEIIVLGALNANFLVPSDSKDLKDIFDIFGFKQMINKPTRITTSS